MTPPPATDATGFDAKRARLKDPDFFQRFRVTGAGEPLRESGLPGKTELLVVERNGRQLALIKWQMIYHHVAQGDLAGEPFVVSF